MTLARLRELLDAYGANAEHWPPQEREAACTLLAQSTEAQRCRDASAALDAVLNRASTPEPSSALMEHILAAAPLRVSAEPPMRKRLSQAPAYLPRRTPRTPRQRARTWRYIGTALPLAAAAALVLWVVYRPTPIPDGTGVTIAEIGVYDAPTDALLTAPGMDALDTVPSFGCTGSGLGCFELEPLNKQSALNGETYV